MMQNGIQQTASLKMKQAKYLVNVKTNKRNNTLTSIFITYNRRKWVMC